MLIETFKSRLSRLSSKKDGDQVVQEFVLTYVSMDVVQMFLQSVDEKYEMFLRHAFITDTINWKSIVYDIRIPFLNIEFDALKMTATLVGISISRKSTKEGEVFKYNLIFHKEHDPSIDSVFAITFLNRKEEDEDGKKVFLEYDTTITPLSGAQIKIMEDEKEDVDAEKSSEEIMEKSSEEMVKDIEKTLEKISDKKPEEVLGKVEEEISDEVPEELLENTKLSENSETDVPESIEELMKKTDNPGDEIPDKVSKEPLENTKPPENSETNISGSVEVFMEKTEEEFPE